MVVEVVTTEVRTAVERREWKEKTGHQLSCARSAADPKSTSCSLSANPRPSLNCPDIHAGLSCLSFVPRPRAGLGPPH